MSPLLGYGAVVRKVLGVLMKNRLPLCGLMKEWGGLPPVSRTHRMT